MFRVPKSISIVLLEISMLGNPNVADVLMNKCPIQQTYNSTKEVIDIDMLHLAINFQTINLIETIAIISLMNKHIFQNHQY